MQASVNVQKRTESGKKIAKRLRREGKIPGVFYFHGEESTNLIVDSKELLGVISDEISLINLKFDDESERQCVIRDIQFDPVNSQPVHIDFMGIKQGEKIHIIIPLHIEGTPKGVKDGGGILQQSTREVEIECLPRDIPEHLSVDVSSLDVGESIHIRDLSFEKITILSEPERSIATVIAPKVVKEEAVEGEELAEVEGEQVEPEVIGKSDKEEGE